MPRRDDYNSFSLHKVVITRLHQSTGTRTNINNQLMTHQPTSPQSNQPTKPFPQDVLDLKAQLSVKESELLRLECSSVGWTNGR